MIAAISDLPPIWWLAFTGGSLFLLIVAIALYHIGEQASDEDDDEL